jgi:hypothetical protein
MFEVLLTMSHIITIFTSPTQFKNNYPLYPLTHSLRDLGSQLSHLIQKRLILTNRILGNLIPQMINL